MNPNSRVESLPSPIALPSDRQTQPHDLHARIFDSAPVMMFRVNREGRVLSVNYATASAVGRDKQDILGLLGGEVINCVNASVGDGCGRGEVCKTCPVRTAVARAFDTGQGVYKQHGKLTLREGGRITVRHLLVTTAFLQYEDDSEVLVSLDDVTALKNTQEELERHQRSLEKLVEQRSAELRRVNQMLQAELVEGQRTAAIFRARARLLEYASGCSLDEVLEATLNAVEELTDSQISFYHFVEPDQESLTLQNWSTRTKTSFCSAAGKGAHYPIAQAGVWVDCFHQQQPVIHNDYESLPHKRGLPPGHARVVRELVVPVVRGSRVVAILGVGNKRSDRWCRGVARVRAA